MGKVRQKTAQDSSLDEKGYPPLEIVTRDEKSGLEIIRYSNGTHSIREPGQGQAMHSRVGPEVESKVVYAEAAQVSKRLATKPSLILWDVGMGTGANVTATLDEIIGHGVGSASLEVHSFENDPRGLELMLRHSDLFPSVKPWVSSLAALLEKGRVEFEVPLKECSGSLRVQWLLHVGDFYQNMKKICAPDLIYFDFYAPRAQPALWHRERFHDLRAHLCDRSTLLFTYSAATPVRLALLLGGFFVGYGPRTPMKAETTIASTRFELLENPLGSAWKQKLSCSSAIEREEERAEALHHSQWSLTS